ncbi:hypothetical protein NDU88_004216 [Pleurodeles waltl]|uniref:Uncharacterized protein n=1 Tax=Pleurodeles waltl TaxID=8319 RepID=A0AAV7MXV0_PLEWA|nr:hypothetical protein NDU88_004216 [Pleurodeles waltl]
MSCGVRETVNDLRRFPVERRVSTIHPNTQLLTKKAFPFRVNFYSCRQASAYWLRPRASGFKQPPALEQRRRPLTTPAEGASGFQNATCVHCCYRLSTKRLAFRSAPLPRDSSPGAWLTFIIFPRAGSQAARQFSPGRKPDRTLARQKTRRSGSTEPGPPIAFLTEATQRLRCRHIRRHTSPTTITIKTPFAFFKEYLRQRQYKKPEAPEQAGRRAWGP